MLNFSGGTSLRGPEYPVWGERWCGQPQPGWGNVLSRGRRAGNSHGGPAAAGGITCIKHKYIFIHIKDLGEGFREDP